MLRNCLILTFLLAYAVSYGQKKQNNADERLFEQAMLLSQLIVHELNLDDVINAPDTINLQSKAKAQYAKEIKEDILEKSLEIYDELVDSFPKSKLFFRALNNKALIEYELEDYKSAKQSYLRILNSNANDKEKGGVGSGLMAEPYANYKNRAAKMLASISLSDSNYSDALLYLDKTTKYPYRHFCGNEYAADKLYMANMYAKCYLGLGNYKKTYEILIPNIASNGLANNSFIVKTAYDALRHNYSSKQLKQKFEEAVDNYQAEKKTTKSGEDTNYYITFLGYKIFANSYELEFVKDEEKPNAIKEHFLKSSFYLLVSQE